MIRLAALALSLSALVFTSAAQAATCTISGSPTSNPATLMNSLSAGDVLCLHAGTYGHPGTGGSDASYTALYGSGTASSPIVVQGYPGEARPVLQGAYEMLGDYTEFSGVVFDGPVGQLGGSAEGTLLTIIGAHGRLSGSEVRYSKSQAVLISGTDFRVTGNLIHHNGWAGEPTHDRKDHGIYVKSGSGLIANNVIRDNPSGFGVQLYPSATDVLVEHNTIIRNSAGGVIVGNESGNPSTARNRIVNNIIASNGESPIETYEPSDVPLPDPNGTNANVSQNNLFYANGTYNPNPKVKSIGNLTGDPLFTSSSDQHLQAASPAVDTATATYSQPFDFDGLARPQHGAPDIGAYERPTTAPTIRSSATAKVNNLRTLTIAKPTGTATGDLLLAAVAHQGGIYGTITPPSGWTEVPNTDAVTGDVTGARTRIFYRVATTSEPASYAFSLGATENSQDIAGGVTAFVGVDPTTPISTSAKQSNATSSSVTAPSLSPAWKNTTLAFVGATTDPTAWTPPTAMSEQYELSTSGPYEVSMELATQPLALSGSTGTRTATIGITRQSVGATLALNPKK